MTGEQCEVMVEEFNELKSCVEIELSKLGEQLAVTNTLLQSILERLKGEHWNGGFTSSEITEQFLNGLDKNLALTSTVENLSTEAKVEKQPRKKKDKSK